VDRIPEPELMLDPEQAGAYAAADFAEPHQRFAALLREKLPALPPVGAALDLGCGPGDPTLRLARSLPGWQLDGVDGSPAMLVLAREAAERAGLAARVRFHPAELPAPPTAVAGRRFDLVLSNSLLHHLPDPFVLWDAVLRFAAPGASVLICVKPVSAAFSWALRDRLILRLDDLEEHFVAADHAELVARAFFDRLGALLEVAHLGGESGVACLEPAILDFLI